MSGVKKIGILTSGGDAPGMNAAIRSVVRTACAKGMKVVGIRHGYQGLLDREFVEMGPLSVTDILHSGGSILHSARCDSFRKETVVRCAADICRQIDIQGLVVIGGDGSFRGAADLSRMGVPCIGIPGTIDNDIACSEYSIGFDTAIGTVHAIADRLRSTSQSHDRCNLIEVMGQRSGNLALHAGIACGATSILVPEIPFTLEGVVEKMERTRSIGKQHFIVIVSEGVTATKLQGAPSVFQMAEQMEKLSGITCRGNEIGYAQRGGAPTPMDRIAASRMGFRAVELLKRGAGSRVVVQKDNRIVDYDIGHALQMDKRFDRELYRLSDIISI